MLDLGIEHMWEDNFESDALGRLRRLMNTNGPFIYLSMTLMTLAIFYCIKFKDQEALPENAVNMRPAGGGGSRFCILSVFFSIAQNDGKYRRETISSLSGIN